MADHVDSLGDGVRKYLPGLLVLAVLALAARLAGVGLPYVSPLILAVALGLVVGTAISLPARFVPGTETHKLWLEAGIVLMGARISLEALLDAGVALVGVVAFGVVLTIALVELLSRNVFGITGKLGSLLAAGAGICGVSAVVGVAGSIRASERHVAYAAATVLLFDVLTLFLYPAIGVWIGLEDRVFGIWAGITMFSTGPVTAAGFAVSETAGEWATVTKLTRNLFLGVLVGVYSLVYLDPSDDTRGFSPRMLWDSVPKFVIGFFALMLVTSSGLFPAEATAALTDAYRWLFLLAFAGLGLSIDVSELRNTGVRPIAVVLTALVVVSVVVLLVLQAVFTL